MRRTVWAEIAVLILVFATRSHADGEEALVDGIAAQVGSDIVLLSEVLHITKGMETEMRKFGIDDAGIAQVRADALERLIERRLIEQVADRAELIVSDAEVDQSISAIATENGLTLDQLRRSVEAQELSYEAYRERIRGEIQRAKIVGGVIQERVRIEEHEVRELYAKRYAEQPESGEEVHLRHLLIPFGQNTTRELACKEAENARKRVLAGEDFAQVAAELSAVNPERGGDVGWVHRKSLAAWMGEAVDQIGPGQTTEVLPTAFGCNLLYLVNRRQFVPATFEAAQEALYNEIYEQRVEADYIEWMESLRAQTYIERKGFFAEAARLGTPPARENPGAPETARP